VLPSQNGVWLGKTAHPSGSQLAWGAGQDLHLGRLHLSARLGSEPLVPEQPLVRGWQAWRSSGLMTAAAAVALLLVQVVSAWLPGNEGSIWPQVFSASLGLALGIVVWAGLWALVGKLFAGRMHYVKHVQIAAVGFALTTLAWGVPQLLGFALSLDSLVKFEAYISAALLAVVVWWHLRWALPISPRRLGYVVAGFTVAGMAVAMGLQLQSQKRLTNNLYMATILPPSWRIAPAVPTDQWLRESLDLKARLDERLRDEHDDQGAEFNELD
jgi:hypothetical protein